MSVPAPRRRPVHSPSSLNRLVRATLEDVFPLVELEGEIGSFRPAASGHWYFVLKDATAEVKVSMFRSRAQLARVRPANGDKVLARGRLSVYEARGDYQLIAEYLEPAGLGERLLALLRLKEQLAAEGLFEPSRKRALPPFPRRLALLTSAHGAALRDVLSVVRRRFPLLQVELWPVLVQGEESVRQIRAALAAITALAPAERPDLLLLTRGGGSQEDLWSFNDEDLARQVAQMPMPVVSAIGHEIDTTLVDLVADLRAATPSAAAELITPERGALAARVAQQARLLRRLLQVRLEAGAQRADGLLRRLELQHPRSRLLRAREQLAHERGALAALAGHWLAVAGTRLARLHGRQQAFDPRQRIGAGHERLGRWLGLLLRARERAHDDRAEALQQAVQRLQLQDPRHAMRSCRRRLAELRARLDGSWRSALQQHFGRLDGLQRTLYAISPQATLDRGYVLLFDRGSGRALASSAQLAPGQALRARLADGSAELRVEQVERD